MPGPSDLSAAKTSSDSSKFKPVKAAPSPRPMVREDLKGKVAENNSNPFGSGCRLEPSCWQGRAITWRSSSEREIRGRNHVEIEGLDKSLRTKGV